MTCFGNQVMFLLALHVLLQVLEPEKQLYNSLSKAQTNHYQAGWRGLDLGHKKVLSIWTVVLGLSARIGTVPAARSVSHGTSSRCTVLGTVQCSAVPCRGIHASFSTAQERERKE